MSEATKELTAEARAWRENQLPQTPWGDGHIVNRLADALATRVPVQGEPNDDREAVTGNELADAVHAYYEASGKPANSEGVRAVLLLSRPTVPDAAKQPEGWSNEDALAAYEQALSRWVGTLDIDAASRNGFRLGAEWQKARETFISYKSIADEARDERDAALAAVDAVRAIHKPVEIEPSDTICGECSFQLPNGTYFGKVEEWPCPTVAALDGAPEPEWECVGLAFEHGGFMRVRKDQLKPEKFDEWLTSMKQYPRVEILKRVKATPAGPWEVCE